MSPPAVATAAPASPAARRLAAPRWRDGRLVGGVLLVLLSVVAGTRVLAAADRTEQVWVAAHDLAPGTVLTAADLRPARVRLPDAAGRYVGVGAVPTGWALQRPVNAGELLPRTALGRGSDTRVLAVPVGAGHVPPGVARGDRVDVYATPRARAGGEPAGTPRLLLGAVPIESVERGERVLGGAAGEVSVVLRVPADAAATVVAAVQAGPLDLVRVP